MVVLPLFFLVVSLHVLAIIGFFLYPPTLSLFLFSLLMAYALEIGITLGFHRCLSHRAFTFKYKFLERAFATLGTMALEGGPIWWSSIHRIHHRYSETEQDPHDTRKGFWFSHILWLAHLDPKWRRPAFVSRFQHHTKDISMDPYYRFLDRVYFLPALTFWTFLFLAGGWAWFFWVGIISTVLNFHFSFLVNSVSHKLGKKPFKTKDASTNNLLLAILGLEGWHNNHHAFPSSPKQGFFEWWQFDFTFLVIFLLEKLKLITNLQYPTKGQILLEKGLS